MRALLALVLALFAALTVQAQEHGGYSCASILANAEKSQADTAMAAMTYFNGKFMGKPCVDIDYVKAVTLMQQADIEVGGLIANLRQRAAAGERKAISALKSLGY
jgi:hypothetical protein